MDKAVRKFYEVFTDLQCYILANMNKGDVNGITATHYNIIEYIYRAEECTGKQIAKAFNITPPAISRQVKYLIENNLVEQHQCSRDRRVFNLKVTDKGKFIIDNSENFRETIARKASQILTKEELKTLTSLLHKMVAEVSGQKQ